MHVRAGLRQSALLLAALAALSSAARAELTATITEWGEVQAEVLGQANQVYGLSAGVLTGPARFVRRSDEIEARLCLQFGYVLALAAGPDDVLPEEVQVTVRHPRLTRPDGATSTGYSYSKDLVDGQVSTGFLFYYAWELQPGAWTFDISADGQALASKTFTVTLPPGRERATACGPAAVS